MTRTLTDNDVRALLDPDALISALETAFGERFPKVEIPVRTQIKTNEGVFLVMPCYDPTRSNLGIKFVVVQRSPARPEERIQAGYVLLDPKSGATTLSAQASYITELRTAATSALATRLLSREDTKVLGIFGTGRQARAHVRMLPRVRRFERILVCGRNRQASERFANEMQGECHLPVEAVDAPDCARSADVICTCTTSPEPLFAGQLLRPGTHINAVGAFQPHTRELDSVAIQKSCLVVESREAALAEAGDLLIPIAEGAIGPDSIAADLHEIVSGTRPGRTSPADITVFKSVGCALEDLVAVELIQKNQKNGINSSTRA